MNPHGVGKRLFTLMLATLVISAIAIQYQSGLGDISVLIRGVDGERTVYSLSLSTGKLSNPVADDGTIVKNRFVLDDGSVITIEPAGVVRVSPGASEYQVLLAAPVAATSRTPLSEWGDGKLLAWVNPGDGSLQVFSETKQGSYAPIYLNQELHPNSFGFSPDGASLVIAKIVGESTDLYQVALADGAIERVATVPGIATIVQR